MTISSLIFLRMTSVVSAAIQRRAIPIMNSALVVSGFSAGAHHLALAKNKGGDAASTRTSLIGIRTEALRKAASSHRIKARSIAPLHSPGLGWKSKTARQPGRQDKGSADSSLPSICGSPDGATGQFEEDHRPDLAAALPLLTGQVLMIVPLTPAEHGGYDLLPVVLTGDTQCDVDDLTGDRAAVTIRS